VAQDTTKEQGPKVVAPTPAQIMAIKVLMLPLFVLDKSCSFHYYKLKQNSYYLTFGIQKKYGQLFYWHVLYVLDVHVLVLP
jgi:hypothetical protein